MTRSIEQVRTELEALKQQARRYQNGMNEGGDGFNPHSEALRVLQAEYDSLMEVQLETAYHAQLSAEDAEWTKEVTVQRRAEWNTWVKSQGKTIHPATMAAHCQAVGWDMLLLKRQIQRHGL